MKTNHPRPRRTCGPMSMAVLLGSVSVCAACTVFFITDGKLTLGGDSEDWFDPRTQVWFIPATESSWGVVYFGFGQGTYPEGGITIHRAQLPPGGVIDVDPDATHGFPQAGINDQGLFFGGAATNAVRDPNPRRKEVFDGFIVDHILRTCGTVKDALVVLDRYTLGLPQGQILFGDRTGESVIVEAGDVVIRRQARHQVITNFRLSQMPDGGKMCARFKTANEMLGAADHASVELARESLRAVGRKPSPDGLEKRIPGTQYSLVFDLTHLEVHLYRSFDFEHPIKLDVKKELELGPRCVRLADLDRAPVLPP